MSSVTITRTLAVGAVTIAAALVLWTLGRAPPDPMLLAPDAERPAPRQPTTTPVAGPSATAGETPAAAKLRELEAMSETFRNTTFLIAIRDSGYVCRELLGVYGGVNDSATWTATCSQMLAYTVRVASSGSLRVEPMLQHVDGLGPTIDQPPLEVEPLLPPQNPRPAPPRR